MKNISGYKSSNYYRVYDVQRNLKRCIEVEKEKSLTDDDWLKGVSCFVINEKGEILIEKRGSTALTPRKLDLCSGHIDNEETETQAMVRELKEELGIEIDESINVRKLTSEGVPLKFSSSNKRKNFFITFYCLKRNKSNVKIQEKEIKEIIWLPLEEAFELIRSGRTKFPTDYDYESIFQQVRNIYNPSKAKETKLGRE